MKKDLRANAKRLVEEIINEDFLSANETLGKLILEAEENREADVADDIDDTGDDTGDEAAEGGDEAAEGGEEEVNTDGIDEPTDGDPNLGDALEDDISDQAVGEAEMSEMSNDVVEISCEINQKIISKLYDKISNLKTALNEKDMDQDGREYVTLETKLSYYGNKLEELQTKTNPAIDQKKVEERIQIIDDALKTLESEIQGDSSEVEDVKTNEQLDNEQTEGGEEGEEPVEGEEGGAEEEEEEPVEGEEEPVEGEEESAEGEEGSENSEQGNQEA